MKRRFFSLITGAFVLSVGLAACSEASPTTLPATPTPSPATTSSASVGPTVASKPTVQDRPPTIKSVTAANKVGQYEKVELTVDLQASPTNPFDPDQVDLQGVFTGPDGQAHSVPGFYWQDYTSRLDNGKENLAPTGQPTWKVRFAATMPGQWSYFVAVKTPQGTSRSPVAWLDVIASTNPGYLRVSSKDPAYLEFSNGTPYVAVGENVGWYKNGGTYDYEGWFKQLSSHGANFARVWMASWSMGLEWSDTGLGDYSRRLDRAWQLDRVFDLAAQDNIYLMLSLLNHGAFNTSTDLEWAKNPYNAALGLGGPCAAPQDFATNQQARQLFQRRLRYIAARWGYSTHLLAWEWWNEIDWTPLAQTALLKPWIAEMTTALRGWEAYPHLKTTSYAKSFDEKIYQMPEIDLVQRHEYSPQDGLATFPRNMKPLQTFGKPVLYAEYGGMGQDTTSLDKTGLHLHNGQWAGLMTKGAGTAMPWWWDTYIEPLDLYGLFSGPASFVKGEDLAGEHYQPLQVATGSTDYSALILKSDQRVLGWVKSSQFSYEALKSNYEQALSQALKNKQKLDNYQPTYPPISGASLPLPDLKPGDYEVEWWDTGGKGVIKTNHLTATDASTRLPLPTFQQDIAFKLILQN